MRETIFVLTVSYFDQVQALAFSSEDLLKEGLIKLIDSYLDYSDQDWALEDFGIDYIIEWHNSMGGNRTWIDYHEVKLDPKDVTYKNYY